MYKNILIATDGSALSRRAARDAVRLARKVGARVTGFYVAPSYHIEVYEDYVPPDLITPREHAANAKITAERHLEYVRNLATESAVPCSGYYVISDHPADAIVKAARKYRCDLIYMGSHGRSGLSKLLLGSQTSKVLAQSRIPVLVHR